MNFINFKYVPVHWRMCFMSIGGIFWALITSVVRGREKIADILPVMERNSSCYFARQQVPKSDENMLVRTRSKLGDENMLVRTRSKLGQRV